MRRTKSTISSDVRGDKNSIALLVESEQDKKPPAQKTQLEERLWRDEQTDFIFKLNEQMSLTLERNEIARYVVNNIQKFLFVHRCALLMFDKNTQKLTVEYALGLNEKERKDISLAVKESISGFVMERKKALMVNDLNTDDYLKKINKEPYLKKSFISVPLIIQKDVLGVLNICDKRTGKPFSQKDLSLLVNVGRITAVAFNTAYLHEEIQNDYVNTIAALASAIDARDPYTKWHSENVTRYSLAMADELGYTYSEKEILRRAALLHDIGKIGIRDNILLKPGKLNDDEFTEIKLHATKGEKIVQSLSFLREAAILIRHHHERYDGEGYPDGIKDEDIELGARIMTVADSFDAMTSDRPYRKALGLDEAIKELQKHQGTQFDPEVAKCFLKIINRNPDILQRPA